MGIFSRLSSIINSYLNDFGMFNNANEETARRFRSSGDPDLDEAYEELNDYLKRKEKTKYTDTSQKTSETKLPPQELRADFEYLGVPFGADSETCKTAYKKLLKIHHPDKHAGHEGNFKKATERSAKINAAWDRIEKWRKNGNLT